MNFFRRFLSRIHSLTPTLVVTTPAPLQSSMPCAPTPDSRMSTSLEPLVPSSSNVRNATAPQPASIHSEPKGSSTDLESMLMQIFALILSFITQLPGIIKLIDQIVLSVEAAFPTATGNQKLAAATAKVNTILGAAVTDSQTLSSLTTVVTPLINASVAAFNAAGTFTKPSTGSAPAAPTA